MMFRRIDHIELVPSDLERSLAFYTEVLGFTVRARRTVGAPPLGDVVFLELGDTMLELLEFDDPAAPVAPGPRVGYRMMAIEVDDMGKALAYLAGKGITPSLAPKQYGASFRAEITDPDGIGIELRQW
jgi:glyoxylase I family protein